MNQKTRKEWIKDGVVDGEKVAKCWDPKKNEWYYLKIWQRNAKHHIDWYKWAAKQGVGVPVVEIENGIRMPVGVKLAKAVQSRLILHGEVKFQLDMIQDCLKKNKIAHCDVKYDNCMFFPRWGVRLIDNGDMARFGVKRMIHTPNQNTTVLVPGQISGQIGPGTDEKGFKQIIQKMNSDLGK